MFVIHTDEHNVCMWYSRP